MTEERRQDLSLQEYKELAEAVREYPCLCDKATEEYKDKIVTENDWKEVAGKLIFIGNSKLKKLRQLSLISVG